MKKLSIIIVLVCAFVLCSCSSGGGGGATFDDVLPWSQENKWFEEISTYDAIRYLGDPESGDSFVITDSASRLVYTLREGKSVYPTGLDEVSPTEKTDASCILLTMDLFVRYKNVEGVPDEYRPLDLQDPSPVEDVAKSWTVFDKNDLTAKFTKRITKTESRSNDDDNGRLSETILLADYTGAFYEDGNGKPAALLKDANGDTEQMNIKSGNYYDNEYIFYLVRALGSIKSDSSKKVSFSQPYDDFLQSKKNVSKRGIKQSTQKSAFLLPIGKSNGDGFVGSNIGKLFGIDASAQPPAEEDELPVIEAYKTYLSLTAKRSGSPLELYFAKNLISVYNDGGYGGGVQAASSPAAKLLLKIVSRGYRTNGSVAFTQSYILRDYTSRTLPNPV